MTAGRNNSLAVAFAAALAKQHKAELVTGDPESKAVEKEIRIAWLPSETVRHRPRCVVHFSEIEEVPADVFRRQNLRRRRKGSSANR